ncbi:MAG: glycosyltransferase, partial [Bacteroidota bacterium]|nr:glycosyltransferase [Bacteroidota bacterium]
MDRKKINILWFTNGPLEPLKKRLDLGSGGTGYWMTALLEKLNSFTDIKIIVATVYPHASVSTSINGVDYHLISQKRSRILPAFETQYIPQCLELINKIKPDIIHIHGTERFYGLLGEHISDIPIIISLQGLIDPCSEWFNTYGNISLKEIIRMETVRRFINGSSPFRGYLDMKHRSKNEIKILQSNSYFVGRTDWDKAYVASHNKHADYYSISEILRKKFYEHTWNIKDTQRHRIFISNCRGPRSGADLMLKAFAIIKKIYSDATLFIAGSNPEEKNNYQQYL